MNPNHSGVKISIWPLLSLTSLAIAHPILEQLGGNPEFFVVKRSEPLDVVLLPILLCFGLPALLFLLARSTAAIHRTAGKWFYSFILSTLIGALVMIGLIRFLLFPGIYIILIGFLLSVFIVTGYHRYQSIRDTFAYTAVFVLVVPVLFLMKAPMRRLIFVESIIQPAEKVTSKIPVVILVLDELPLTSLLNKTGAIDPDLFPNLARFSNQASWFRNTSTVSNATSIAVPAILTGMYPQENLIPTYHDHPKNLFTMLQDSYTLNVFETATRLCPNQTWEKVTRFNFQTRMLLTLKDLSAIYLHLITPGDMSEKLPRVMQDWGNFWREPKERVGDFENFIDSIEPSSKPALHFYHSSLPHSPWTSFPNPDRVEYLRERITENFLLPESDLRAKFEDQLLQIALVDELIGKLFKKLKTTELFDRSLIIITSDHGVSLRNEREIMPDSVEDIMLVPLLIKAPHQDSRRTSDRNVETIDILPTIADVLNVPAQWAEGSSLLDSSITERKSKKLFIGGKQRFREFTPGMFEASRKLPVSEPGTMQKQS